jgi:hypothetical protein
LAFRTVTLVVESDRNLTVEKSILNLIDESAGSFEFTSSSGKHLQNTRQVAEQKNYLRQRYEAPSLCASKCVKDPYVVRGQEMFCLFVCVLVGWLVGWVGVMIRDQSRFVSLESSVTNR